MVVQNLHKIFAVPKSKYVMKFLNYLLLFFSIISFSQPSYLGYELNGDNDYLRVPNTSYINIGGSFENRTIETWFKVDDVSSKQVIYEEGAQVNAIVLYIDSGRLYCGAYRNNGSSALYFRTSNGVIQDDTWYHVAFVIDSSGSDTNFSWYLNGVLQDSQDGFAIPSHSGDINLGSNGNLRYANCNNWSASSINASSSQNCSNASGNDNNKYYFAGNLWGFRIWNSGRTASQINETINLEINEGNDLVAYLDGDYVHYLNSSGNWVDVRANGNNNTYYWSPNANSSNWNHPGNWQGSNGPSTSQLKKVVIGTSNNYPVINSEVRIGELELSTEEAELTIEDGGTLNVYYKVENSGTITIENNGSFILQDDDSVLGDGNFIVKRDTPDYPAADYYSIWSTPVHHSDSQLGTIFNFPFVGYGYDASVSPSAYVQIGGSNYMEVGEAYFIRPDNDSGVLNVSFTGKVNNGTIEVPIYHNSSADNFNLLGNPYSSALDWLAFQEDNSQVLSGTAYFWSQSFAGLENLASDYISFNLTGSNVPGTSNKIGTAQGVFVKSLQSGTVTFKNTHRVVGNNDQFFRAASNPNTGKSWLKLSGNKELS